MLGDGDQALPQLNRMLDNWLITESCQFPFRCEGLGSRSEVDGFRAETRQGLLVEALAS